MNVFDTDDEIERLLTQVDPFNNKKMTYSEVVLVLSSHMVPKEPSGQIALLEKFIQENEGEEDGLRMAVRAQQEELGFDNEETN